MAGFEVITEALTSQALDFTIHYGLIYMAVM
jgi:hypothetical protein